MGRLKQLLPLGDKTVIRHCLDRIVDAGIKDIVAVVGRDAYPVAREISDTAAKIAFNPAPESEMAESVRIGLLYADTRSTGVLVCLSDHPLVSSSTIESVIMRHGTDGNKIIVPVCNGKKGHPTLFPSAVIREIFSGCTLRDIACRDTKRVVYEEVDDEGIFFDMDTMEDYRAVIGRFGS
jgi:molybdenum cofactor cytidylyltransferase